MYIAMNRFKINRGQEEAFEHVWKTRETHLDNVPGFNNFHLLEENLMTFDATTMTYNARMLLKQGFYNYTFVTKDTDGTISQSDIRGDFSKTENEYTVIVYYKPLGGLYDRVIGVGTATFVGER